MWKERKKKQHFGGGKGGQTPGRATGLPLGVRRTGKRERRRRPAKSEACQGLWKKAAIFSHHPGQERSFTISPAGDTSAFCPRSKKQKAASPSIQNALPSWHWGPLLIQKAKLRARRSPSGCQPQTSPSLCLETSVRVGRWGGSFLHGNLILATEGRLCAKGLEEWPFPAPPRKRNAGILHNTQN